MCLNTIVSVNTCIELHIAQCWIMNLITPASNSVGISACSMVRTNICIKITSSHYSISTYCLQLASHPSREIPLLAGLTYNCITSSEHAHSSSTQQTPWAQRQPSGSWHQPQSHLIQVVPRCKHEATQVDSQHHSGPKHFSCLVPIISMAVPCESHNHRLLY